MDTLTIRKATYFDIDAIVNIYKAQINEIRAFKRSFIDLYRKPRFHIFVLIQDKNIIGFYTVEYINGLMPRRYVRGVKTAWVHFIAVSEQGKGYGKMMMTHLENNALLCGDVTGIGLHSNMRSYPFYEKVGLVIKGKIKHGHLPKLYMYKELVCVLDNAKFTEEEQEQGVKEINRRKGKHKLLSTAEETKQAIRDVVEG